MATIITRGVPPDRTWFIDQLLGCKECATVFTLDNRDVAGRGWEGDEERITGHCPICGAELTFTRDEALQYAKERAYDGNPGG